MKTLAASVIVPIRNEEKYIGACLKSLLQQSLPGDSYEIIVVDGRSSDRSKEIVEEIQRDFLNVRCLDNPAAIAPVAMNIGIRSASGRIIIRADGHNFYPATYIENCIKYLDQTGAENVGGPWLTVPADQTFGARLVAAILSNPFGVGGSRFRTSQADGFVETVPFGAFRRELFDRIGLYNEKLVRNQDNELNARIIAAGGKIYQTSALQTEYHPVASFSELLRQIFKTSQWHVFSIRENKRSMGFRHLAPAAFVLVLVALLSLSLLGPSSPAWLILARTPSPDRLDFASDRLLAHRILCRSGANPRLGMGYRRHYALRVLMVSLCLRTGDARRIALLV